MRKVIRFLKEVRQELAKVVWPTRRRTARLTVLVIVGTVLMGGFLFAVDYALGEGIQYVIDNADKKPADGNGQVPFGEQQGQPAGQPVPAQPAPQPITPTQ